MAASLSRSCGAYRGKFVSLDRGGRFLHCNERSRVEIVTPATASRVNTAHRSTSSVKLCILQSRSMPFTRSHDSFPATAS